MDGTADPAAELAAAQRRLRRRMVRIAIVAAVAAATAVGLLAWCSRPGPEVPPIERPYLWRVTGAGEPSHVFGTMHVGHAVDDLPASVLEAQAGARTTVVESDLLAERVAPPPARGGRARLPDEVWRDLAALTGVAEGELVAWPTSRLVGAAIFALAPRAEPMDRGLQRRAATLGQDVVFLEDRSLEDVADEGALLDGLAAVVRHPGAFRAELRELVRRYARGDDDGCARGAGPTAAMVPALNARWAPAIEQAVRRGGAFVAIGCAHLAGPDSILERLRRAGLTVERVER